MYSATFEINGLYGNEAYTFTGETPICVLHELMKVQDLDCLLQMGQMQGDELDKPALIELKRFLGKYHRSKLNVDDLKNLDIVLTIGSLRCTNVEII